MKQLNLPLRRQEEIQAALGNANFIFKGSFPLTKHFFLRSSTNYQKLIKISQSNSRPITSKGQYSF